MENNIFEINAIKEWGQPEILGHINVDYSKLEGHKMITLRFPAQYSPSDVLLDFFERDFIPNLFGYNKIERLIFQKCVHFAPIPF